MPAPVMPPPMTTRSYSRITSDEATDSSGYSQITDASEPCEAPITSASCCTVISCVIQWRIRQVGRHGRDPMTTRRTGGGRDAGRLGCAWRRGNREGAGHRPADRRPSAATAIGPGGVAPGRAARSSGRRGARIATASPCGRPSLSTRRGVHRVNRPAGIGIRAQATTTPAAPSVRAAGRPRVTSPRAR